MNNVDRLSLPTTIAHPDEGLRICHLGTRNQVRLFHILYVAGSGREHIETQGSKEEVAEREREEVIALKCSSRNSYHQDA
ncbi:hypothetical protein L2E82_40860 [Cichorium intybus]|uniref:Uncharacterized protein n=1 Tax=Cichorium intybus TaxID=13427 RepID=A0ACB9AN34_CICIN|nr:hypothetical protein L2E82_40860 [Cichorium intybus]